MEPASPRRSGRAFPSGCVSRRKGREPRARILRRLQPPGENGRGSPLPSRTLPQIRVARRMARSNAVRGARVGRTQTRGVCRPRRGARPPPRRWRAAALRRRGPRARRPVRRSARPARSRKGQDEANLVAPAGGGDRGVRGRARQRDGQLALRTRGGAPRDRCSHGDRQPPRGDGRTGRRGRAPRRRRRALPVSPRAPAAAPRVAATARSAKSGRAGRSHLRAPSGRRLDTKGARAAPATSRPDGRGVRGARCGDANRPARRIHLERARHPSRGDGTARRGAQRVPRESPRDGRPALGDRGAAPVVQRSLAADR